MNKGEKGRFAIKQTDGVLIWGYSWRSTLDTVVLSSKCGIRLVNNPRT